MKKKLYSTDILVLQKSAKSFFVLEKAYASVTSLRVKERGWADGAWHGHREMGVWQEKSTLATELLFDVADEPGEKILAVPTLFFALSSLDLHLNCWIHLVQLCFHKDQKREAEKWKT